jgi:hypothetical protein
MHILKLYPYFLWSEMLFPYNWLFNKQKSISFTCDTMSWSSLEVKILFGGICYLYLQGRGISRARYQRESGSQVYILLGSFFGPEEGGNIFNRITSSFRSISYYKQLCSRAKILVEKNTFIISVKHQHVDLFQEMWKMQTTTRLKKRRRYRRQKVSYPNRVLPTSYFLVYPRLISFCMLQSTFVN